jgi:processive 1,2-diacylglycerol beta-glucosyltransferase
MAIEDAFRRSGLCVDMIDTLDHARGLYRFLYRDFYLFVSGHAKWFWRLIYYISDIGWFDRLTRAFRAGADYSGTGSLGETLAEKDPDIIISTHFILPSIARILRRKGVEAKMYTLITDYGPHYCWYSTELDGYFVGAPRVKKELVARGIDEDIITVSGIPTEKKFSAEVSDTEKERLYSKYGLEKGKRTVLLMSGGFGTGPVERIVKAVDKSSCPLQMILVCGRNRHLFERINRKRRYFRHKLSLLGFTDNIDEIMRISDIIVTKAGGMSVTEALNAKLPMLLYGSIPGQESWNVDFLVEKGAAEKVVRISQIPVLIEKAVLSGHLHEKKVEAIDRLRRPDADETIVSTVLKKEGQSAG